MAAEPTFAVVRLIGKEGKTPRREAWTLAQMELALGLFTTREEKDGPAWSPVSYPPGATRRDDAVEAVSCLVLDFDRGHAPDDLLDHWRAAGLRVFVHSTFSHTDELPKWRAAFPLARPVPGAEWPETHARLVRRLAHGLTDPSCKDRSRLYYLPSCPPGAPRFAESVEGSLLDPSPTFEDEVGDEEPDAPPAPRAVRPRPEGRESPGDWYERTAEWAPLLEAAGGRFVRRSGRRDEWRRPGKRDGISATTGNGHAGQDLLKVHTSSWPPFEAGEVLTKFFCFTRLRHGGDYAAAIAAIKAMPGYPPDEGGAGRASPPLPPGPPLGLGDMPVPDDRPTPAEVTDEPEPEGRYHDPQGFWRRFALGDVGNAERFVQAFGRDLRHVAGLGWFVYEGERWRKGDEGQLVARRKAMGLADVVVREGLRAADDKAKDALYALAASLRNKRVLDPMLSLAAAFPQVEARLDDFDRDPYLLGARNGVVDLRTAEVRKASAADMITMRCGCDYEPREAPAFLAFLEQTMLGRQDLMRFLTVSLGYSLSGATSTRAFWFLSGSGGNGKGVLTKLVGRLAGDYATTLMPSSIMVKKTDQIPADLAKLQGKRLVTVPEVNDERRLDEGLVKALSGFDEITARFLNQNFVEFTPCAKIWMSGNQRPQVKNFDRAMRQRVRVVPFEMNLDVAEQDTSLPDRLWDEAPGVLWLLVQAFGEYARRGLPAAPDVEEATDAYQASTDTATEFIAEECDTSDEHARTARPRVFKAYVQWCRDNQTRPLGKQKFYVRLGELGYKTSDTVIHGDPVFIGIRPLGDGEFGAEREA